MRVRVLVGFLVLVCFLAVSAPAQARHLVHVDMFDIFNRDVIVNGTTAENVDTTQAPVDISETSFITQGAAKVLPDCTDDPDGLPNAGRFAENEDHPFIKLGYNNNSDRRNARRSPGADSYRVPVPHYRYRAMHVIATAGNGAATMSVKLNFVNGPPKERTFTVPDWYELPDNGYALIDDRDRAHPSGSECYDDDAPALFGFRIFSDPERKLRNVRIMRPTNDGEAVLNVFGITGRRLGAH
jgi:hypothetical protein